MSVSCIMSEAAQGWNPSAASNHHLIFREITAMAEAKPITKVCTQCGEEKPLHEYHVKKANSDGRAARCKVCVIAKRRAKPYSEWTEEQRARMRAYKAKYRLRAGRKPMAQIKEEARKKNARIELWEKNAVQAFDYWMRHRATDEQISRWWAAHPSPWLDPRLTDAEQYKMKYALDVEFQVKERMRRQVSKAKKRDGIASVMREAIYRGGSSRKVERELGYSIAELKRHLELQFTRGMNWQKFASGQIHIDHIIPQAAFDMADDDEWRRCWCLSNLRPMWAKENLAKRDKVMTLC